MSVSDSEYQRVFEEVYKELVTPALRKKLEYLVSHADDRTIDERNALAAEATALEIVVAGCREREQARQEMEQEALAAVPADRFLALYAAIDKCTVGKLFAALVAEIVQLETAVEQITAEAGAIKDQLIDAKGEAHREWNGERDAYVKTIENMQLRPPMSCTTCEDHNNALCDRIRSMNAAVCDACRTAKTFVAANVWPLQGEQMSDEEFEKVLAEMRNSEEIQKRHDTLIESAKRWQRTGGHPCGEPGCGCEDCRLYSAVVAYKELTP